MHASATSDCWPRGIRLLSALALVPGPGATREADLLHLGPSQHPGPLQGLLGLPSHMKAILGSAPSIMGGDVVKEIAIGPWYGPSVSL